MDANKSFFLHTIFESFKKSSSRTLTIFISILIGACVSSAFIGVYADIESKVTSELNSYGPNISISPANFESDNYIDTNALNTAISKVDSGKLLGVGKYLFGTVNIGPTSAIIMGTNFSTLKNVMPYLDIKSGEFINLDFDDKSALIGADLAKVTGFKVGDNVEISQLGNGNNVVYNVKIKGIVFDGDKEDNLLIVSLPLVQKILNKENKINYAQAIIDDQFDYVSKISKEVSTNSIEFNPISKVSKSQGVILDKIKLLMALVSFVILIITSLCVNTSLSAILLSKLKEFALLRAIGASKRNILNMIATEIGILSIVASIVGAFVGLALAQVVGKVIFDSYISLRWESIVFSVIITLIFVIVASYYPLKKALMFNLANLLRGE